MSHFHNRSATFWTKPAGVWQLAFWGVWVALSALLAVGWLSEPLSTGRFFIALLLTLSFAGFLVNTQRGRIRAKRPVLITSTLGLQFRPGTNQAKFITWGQLKNVQDNRGQSIVFETIDNRLLGDRVFGLIPTGICIPVNARTEDGLLLTSLIARLWHGPDDLSCPE